MTMWLVSNLFQGLQKICSTSHTHLHVIRSLPHIVHLTCGEYDPLSPPRNLMIQRCSMLGVTESNTISYWFSHEYAKSMAMCGSESSVATTKGISSFWSEFFFGRVGSNCEPPLYTGTAIITVQNSNSKYVHSGPQYLKACFVHFTFNIMLNAVNLFNVKKTYKIQFSLLDLHQNGGTLGSTAIVPPLAGDG